MTSIFDVLRQQDNGVMWICAASTLEEAHSRISADTDPNALGYVILNSQTGHRITVSRGNGDDVG